MAPYWIRILFILAGLYDFFIGVAFFAFGPKIFELTEVPPPNHWGYIQFGASLLVIFGIMFLTVAYDPVENRNLMIYGMLLKISYTGLAGYYWFTTDIPMVFKPFAIIDGIMLVFFIIAYLQCLRNTLGIRPSA